MLKVDETFGRILINIFLEKNSKIWKPELRKSKREFVLHEKSDSFS